MNYLKTIFVKVLFISTLILSVQGVYGQKAFAAKHFCVPSTWFSSSQEQAAVAADIESAVAEGAQPGATNVCSWLWEQTKTYAPRLIIYYTVNVFGTPLVAPIAEDYGIYDTLGDYADVALHTLVGACTYAGDRLYRICRYGLTPAQIRQIPAEVVAGTDDESEAIDDDIEAQAAIAESGMPDEAIAQIQQEMAQNGGQVVQPRRSARLSHSNLSQPNVAQPDQPAAAETPITAAKRIRAKNCGSKACTEKKDKSLGVRKPIEKPAHAKKTRTRHKIGE